MAGIPERVGVLETRMNTVEAGVANFRSFQTRAHTYFDRAEAVLEADENRRKRRWRVIAVAALFLVPPTCWGASKLWNIAANIYQIEEQWKLAHPSEFVPHKSVYASPEAEYADGKSNELSTIPPLAR